MRKVALFLVIFILLIINTSCNRQTGTYTQIYNSSTVFSQQDMEQDLKYMQRIIKLFHPAVKDQNLQVQIDQLVASLLQKIETPLNYDEFYFIVLEAFTYLRDAHTGPLYGQPLQIIPLYFSWLDEGLIINQNTEYLKKGDLILKIGNKTPEELLEEMRKYIPSENDYWVQEQSQGLLRTKVYLNKLRLIHRDYVEIEVERVNGKKESIRLRFVERGKSEQKTSYEYKIDVERNLGVFNLNQSIYDEGYIQTLRRFFAEVKQNNITRITVDLRENTGGNTYTIDEFLKYLSVNKVKGLTSPERYNQEGISEYVIDHNNMIDLYKGEVYVLISNRTFSAANAFAGAIKSNNLGTLLGEPTGNSPSSYGEIKVFSLPNSKITFSISTKLFISSVQGNTIEPDVYIPLTRQDIMNGTDPVIEWLMSR